MKIGDPEVVAEARDRPPRDIMESGFTDPIGGDVLPFDRLLGLTLGLLLVIAVGALALVALLVLVAGVVPGDTSQSYGVLSLAPIL